MSRRLRAVRARREDGTSAVEYGLLVAAVAALVVVVVLALGNIVTDVFEQTCDSVAEAAPTPSPSPGPTPTC